MAGNEAKARIKINKLLEEAGWRFFDTEKGSANVLLEQNVKLTQALLDELGNDFEKTKNGFTDYSLIGADGRVVAVVEAKAEYLNPLIGKEQAQAWILSIVEKLKYHLSKSGTLLSRIFSLGMR